MADDDAPAENGEEKATKEKGGGALGPIIAMILVMAVGAGVALVLASAISDDDAEEEVADPTQVEGTGEGPSKPWHEVKTSIDLGEILANVSHEQGRRYVKVAVQVWVKQEDSQLLMRPEYLPVMQEVVQEHLRTYDLQQLDHESVTFQIKRQVQEAMDKKLREILASTDPEKQYIEQVVLQNFLVQ